MRAADVREWMADVRLWRRVRRCARRKSVAATRSTANFWCEWNEVQAVTPPPRFPPSFQVFVAHQIHGLFFVLSNLSLVSSLHHVLCHSLVHPIYMR